MGLLAQLDEPLYEGQIGTSPEVPGTFDVAIDAHPFMIDTEFIFGRRDAFRHASIPAQRAAQDITSEPGEATINPQGLWRSEFQDWSMGSGQLFYDREHSQPNRFHHSQGVDVFSSKGYASLLVETQLLIADTDASCQVLAVGAYIYRLNSTGVFFIASDFSGGWSTVQGLGGVTPVMMATDGNTVYIACGSSGVYSTPAGDGADAATHLVNVSGQDVTFVGYAANVLLVGDTNSIYQVSTTITNWPTALITANDSSWLWTCCCAGNGWIYLGGFSGGGQDSASVSNVYKTQMASDGTTLVAPAVATPLPPGEVVYSLFAFVNYIFMGTSLGVRFCETLGLIDPSGQDTGLLKIGPIVPNLQEPMTLPCRCFTANQRFVYFGWSNFDQSINESNADLSAATGLGWLDISTFTGEQTPAYTSHLMVPATGEVTSAAWLVTDTQDVPIFVVQGVGVYYGGTSGDLVGSGWIESGYIAFRLPDKKQLIAASCDLTPDLGSLRMTVTVDDTDFTDLGRIEGSGLFNVPLGTSGELFETVTYLQSADSPEGALRRSTLQAFPEIAAGTSFVVALRLFDSVETRGGARRDQRVYAELAYLENLRQTQVPVVFQEGSASWMVVVDDIDMVWYQRSTLAFGGFQGCCVVTLKTATSGLIT